MTEPRISAQTGSAAAVGAARRATADAHRVRLTADWSLWRWVRLRAAGFPASWVLDLAAERCCEAAERFLDDEGELERLRQEATRICRRRLSAVAASGRRGALQPLRKTLARLRAAAPEPPSAEICGAELAAALGAAQRRAEESRQALSHGLEQEEERIADRLRAVAGDNTFREAVLWQNRSAVRHALDRLRADQGEPSNAHDRRRLRARQQLIANYVQRYCVKNDTIGFFGPLGWGRFVPPGPAISLRPGRGLLAARKVSFEHWAIDAVASRLAAEPALRRWSAPRRRPSVELAGDRLRLPNGRQIHLPSHYARVLAICDGEHSAVAIARRLIAAGDAGLASEEAVLAVLGELLARGLITWTFEIPPHAAEPERVLEQWLEGIPDSADEATSRARRRALTSLAELGGRRRAVARAAGDSAALEQALSRLEESFTAAARIPANRRPGETYAGRGVVYEDCRRDLELQLGEQVLARLELPLDLLLTSARWYTHVIASRFSRRFRQVYEELRSATSSPAVGYLQFWRRIAPHFEGGGKGPAIVEAAATALAERWESLLGVHGSRVPHAAADPVAPIQLDAVRLAPAVRRAFAAPGPGWPGARHHSPDVLMAAASAAAACRGDFLLVLGELHAAMNSLITPLALAQHPQPAELLAARDLDIPLAGVRLVPKREVFQRAAYTHLSPRDFDLEIGTSRSWRPRNQVLAVGELLVEEVAGNLTVRTRDGRCRFPIMAFFDDLLTAVSFGHFRPVRPLEHTPRVSLDSLVLAREQWCLNPTEIPFLPIQSRTCRTVEALHWARRHRMPRFVFAQMPHEPKPFYLDFLSPILVEIFAKRARNATVVRLSEMLPDHNNTWVTDAEGRRYTSELRIAAVDSLPWRPAVTGTSRKAGGSPTDAPPVSSFTLRHRGDRSR